jgi:hypothetical protein
MIVSHSSDYQRSGPAHHDRSLPLSYYLSHGAERVFSLGEIASEDASRWCAPVVMLVPYGGWLASGLQAGETALVNAATRNFGSAAVAVALAMGAGAVSTRDSTKRGGPR